MKKLLLTLGLIGGFSAMAFADTYTLEPTHSYVEFHYNHVGFSNPSGKWYATGSLNFESQNIAKSSAKIDIQVTNLVTGLPKLDKHLLSADFFDVAKYPTATFVSNKVTDIKGKQFNLVGVLTLHGVSKPITLAVTQNADQINPNSGLPTAGFSATANLKRSDFGIANYVPKVSDEIQLNIEIEATKGS